ncbi:cadherin-related family member 4 isoform X4 [Melospiza georgiana]|uniref:cadherin-related family member 4 isoform X4 n=1 Tax=Melospiza georgiana TaxID=44398 RepID=UPI0025ACFF86|nr:cadherin-related family member 4 isoform X4 [Melospiza georgiana]
MGMHGHLTFLLLSLCAPGTFVRATVLPDLPRVVTLSEDTVPGARVAEVTVSCSNSSSSPNVTLHSIEPEHPFNSIAISSDPTDATTFRAEVTLRAGAELDARRVNQYTLILRAACPGEDEVEERLFVRVTAGHVLRCDTLFASPETGEIRSTRQLPASRAQLLIQAYNVLHPDDRATATVNVTVRGTDRLAPRCVPAIFVSQVPETTSPGSTLVTLRCTGSTSTDGCLHYALEGPPSSLSHFCMEGPQLKVNTTLDYDSEAMAALGFQFTATIVVTVGGQPRQSTRVPVLVTVTPVNEFRPACPSSATFTVPETAAFGSVVGRVAGTDRDYPQDSLEYSLEGGPGPAQPFSIDRRTGEIRVVGALHSQQHKSYRLAVRLTDTHHDLDPRKRQSRVCDVSVRLQAVPDQLPECTPEVQELRITAGAPGSRQPVTRLLCHGGPDSASLTYTIVGGNEDGRFRMEGSTLVYLPAARAEPRPSVLLVEVGGGSGGRRRSSLVALVVQVTPRSTPVPASTTTQRTTLQKEPLVVLHTEAAWHPPAWFVAVLTISGVLLLATLGCTARSLLCSKRASGKLFLAKSSWGVVEHGRDKEEQGHPHASSPGQLDGHAQHRRAGRDYLFRSVTGARRWI